jgi:hypothetical protein
MSLASSRFGVDVGEPAAGRVASGDPQVPLSRAYKLAEVPQAVSDCA